MELHKKDMGSLGESLVISQAIEEGCSVFPEFGDNSKIDLIIESRDRKLHRVQVKMVGREERTPEVTKLYLYKSGPNYSFTYDSTMIDWFAVVDMVTKKIAWVNSDVLTKYKCQIPLRHTKPKNGQVKNIVYFDDFIKFPFN